MNLREYLLNESIEDRGILKAIFMVGTPGAGKSYVIKQINDGQIQPKIVNTDTFTEFFGNGSNADWSIYGSKIQELTKKQLSFYLNSMLPLWIDGTSSDPKSLFRRQGILKSIGYDVGLVWVDTPIDDALRRNSERKRQVPEDFIKTIYNKIEPLKTYYKSEFRPYYEILNGEGELIEPVITSAYKKCKKFFNDPIINPIGASLIESMKKNKHKYLEDTGNYNIQQINKLADIWYK